MNELLKRTLTAIGFGAVMLAGLTIHEFGFLALMLIIHTGCLWEYQLLIAPQQEYRIEQKKKAFVYSMVSGTIIFYLLSTGFRFLFFINDYIYFLIVPLLQFPRHEHIDSVERLPVLQAEEAGQHVNQT